MGYAVRIPEGGPADLAGIDPRADGGLGKSEGEAQFELLAAELGDLQELLYAAGSHALLVVLQGMDTSGKDGALRSVFKEVDPQGVRAVPFKVPTPLELGHDFLWRVHREVPERGAIVVFNRSHYEAVLVERVKELVPEAIWRARYEHIIAFERLLAENGTVVRKFYLHIGEAEQEERLLEREADITKAWKLNVGDWVDRRAWDRYIAAYEEALARCSTAAAPWYVVPADRKWFRNLAMAEVLVETLRPLREGWLATLRERGERELALVRAERERVQETTSRR
ncbi:MAG: polyphosphate kinase 2 family protein [Chloroflexia bacterium]|nr:polyphosphate kinase 2 family protein [Chloroflexia bacterium]